MANEWYVQESCIIQPAALKLHKSSLWWEQTTTVGNGFSFGNAGL